MTISARADSFVAPTFTQQSLFNGIKTAFLNAGFTATFDDYTSGTDKVVVYAIMLDSTKTNGTSYLKIRLTTGFIIGQQILSTWNATTKAGTGGSTELTYPALATTTQVNFVSLAAVPELSLVMLTQGTTAIALGCLSPINRPSWWDLNAWNYSFIPITNTFTTFRATTLNPYLNTEQDCSLNAVRMAIANSQTNRRDLLPGVIFYSQTNQGISGRSSDDLVMVSASGSTRYDILQIPGDTKQYLILSPISGGLAVRIA